MSSAVLHIAFEQHQVIVEAHSLDIAIILKQWFHAMLVPPLSQMAIARQLIITQLNHGYRLQDSSLLNKTFADTPWLLQAVKYEIVTSLIHARPDLLWFHAGAVAAQDGAILVASPGGGGKSTLITRLSQQGWCYLSDDAIPFDVCNQTVLPFPQTPRIRENTGALVPSNQLATIAKHDVMLTGDRLCTSPMRLKGLLFPRYCPNTSAQLTPYSPAQATIELLRNCINFTYHKQTAIQQLCNITQSCPAASLIFNNADHALTCVLNWQSSGSVR
ncbi:MAG TPA: hypothetical protein ACFE0H_05865 [Elainellaceae cyanobacterium]